MRKTFAAVAAVAMIISMGVVSSGCATTYMPTVKNGNCSFDRVWTPPHKGSDGKMKDGYCRWPNAPRPTEPGRLGPTPRPGQIRPERRVIPLPKLIRSSDCVVESAGIGALRRKRSKEASLATARVARALGRSVEAQVYTDVRPLSDRYDLCVANTDDISHYCSSADWVASAVHTLHPGHHPLLVERDNHWVAFTLGNHHHIGPYLQPLEADWGFASPLIGRDMRQCIELLVDTLRAAADRWQVALLSGLPRATAEMAALALDEDYRVVLRDGIRCQVARLSGGVDAFFERRSASARRNLRRDQRRTRREGIEFQLLPHNADVDVLIARVLEVERRSWKYAAGQSVLLNTRYRSFYRAVLQRAAERDALWALFARQDGRDLAYVFGGVLDDTYRGFQLGYDAHYAQLGLGNQVQLALIEALCAAGIDRYDLGMEMRYKDRWSDELLDLANLVVVAER